MAYNCPTTNAEAGMPEIYCTNDRQCKNLIRKANHRMFLYILEIEEIHLQVNLPLLHLVKT